MTGAMLGRLRDRIVHFLESNPASSPHAVQTAMRIEGDGVLIRQTLCRMVDVAILDRVGYGKYSIRPGYKLRMKTVDSDTEDLILEVLIDMGGVAFTKEIHEAVWGGERGKDERPTDYNRVIRVLGNSALFHQDFGRGVWNLAQDQLEQLPLPGRWAGRALGKHNAGDRDEFFQEVGEAFAEARDELSFVDVCAEPSIAAALDHMGTKAHRATGKALMMQRRDVGLGGPEIALTCYLYLLFEEGEPDLHMAAPASFYRECARRFGGSEAADLSRGSATSDLREIASATVANTISSNLTWVE